MSISRPLAAPARLVLLVAIAIAGSADEGTLVQRPYGSTTAPYGFLEHLPIGYATSARSYPLLIHLAGAGERGNGTTELSKVGAAGAPRMISNGNTYFSTTNPSIVIAPQCPTTSIWKADLIDGLITYCVATYRVDRARIYVTGYSLGGGGTWDYAEKYADKLAAILPICGASAPSSTKRYAAMAQVPTWAFHRFADSVVPRAWSDGWVSGIAAACGGATPTDAMSAYPYGTGQTVNASTCTGAYGMATGWRWTTGQAPTTNAPMYTVIPGTTHGGWNEAYNDLAVWNWLYGKVRATPYGGVAAKVPGTIEAERYDVGGEGITWHDTTATNSGGALRSDGVDLAAISGGTCVVDTAAGEWLDYTVTVASAGSYDLALRVASAAGGGSLRLALGGGSALCTAIAVGATGGDRSWSTVTAKGITLAAGTQRLRLLIDRGGFALDSFALTTAGPIELVIDNADTACTSTVGTWKTNTAITGYWAANYAFADPQGKAGQSFTFRPDLPRAGSYRVDIRWPASSTRDTRVPVDVVHNGTTSTLSVDETVSGNAWNTLGTWTFAAGTGGCVTVRTDGTSGWVIADAVRFVEQVDAPADVIVDDADVQGVAKSGAWTGGTVVAGYFRSDYLYNATLGAGGAKVTFTPTLPHAGTYDVFIWHPADANRECAVPVDVLSSSGTATQKLDMRVSGGQWRLLGRWSFASGTAGSVVVRTDGTTARVCADAVRFVEVAPSAVN